MMRRIAALTLCLFFLSGCQAPSKQPIRHLAFGSCLKHDKPAPIFDVINEQRPDVFVFVGDNIYGDTADMETLKYRYFLFRSRPRYQVLEQQSEILATWDDHDYGADDAGLEYEKRAESQQVFLDNFDEPQGSERRRTEGIYTSYLFGPREKRVQVILLDNRYFRTPLKSGDKKDKGGRYVPINDPNATMLGDTQWRWLERELQQEAKIRFILGGTQILREHNGYEAWANMPLELERLESVIKGTQANGVIFLTGDTHWAELSRRHWDGCYPVYDFTSSGLSEVWSYMSPNKYRVAEKAFLGANFGSVRIDWEAAEPVISLEAIDNRGTVQFSHKISLSELQFDESKRLRPGR